MKRGIKSTLSFYAGKNIFDTSASCAPDNKITRKQHRRARNKIRTLFLCNPIPNNKTNKTYQDQSLARRLNVLLRGLVEGSGLGLGGINVGKEVETEANLRDEVSDGDDANLLGQAESASALRADDPDDGVHKPHKDGEPGEALERVATVSLSVVEALEEEHENDDQKDQRGNPPHVLVGGDSEGTDEAADDVQHHVANEGDDGGGIRAGQQSEVRKDELHKPKTSAINK